MDTLTIRANPGRTIGNTPLVFCEAFRTNHESAATTPAKGFFLLTAMADILSSATTTVGTLLAVGHFYSIGYIRRV